MSCPFALGPFPRTLVVGLLGWLSTPLCGKAQQPSLEPACTSVAVGECAAVGRPRMHWFWKKRVNDVQWLGEQAAQAAVMAKHLQTRNGEILSQTLWNYNFEEKSGDLHPSGVALLNRLARNCPADSTLEVFVATTHDFDLDYTPDDPQGFLAKREGLDEARFKTVRDYLRLVLRRENVRLLIYDPKPVGMGSDEALAASRRMLTWPEAGIATDTQPSDSQTGIGTDSQATPVDQGTDTGEPMGGTP